MRTVGFIGLGHMGSPMVKNLLKNNYRVKVYDVVSDAVSQLVNAGAIAAKSPAEIAENSDVVITMLQTGDQVKKSCYGEQGIFAHLKKSNAVYIDCSSIDIQSSRELHLHAKSCGISMLDAPVSGGVTGAAAGILTLMVGADENDFTRALPILQVIGKKIIHAGSAGSGVAAKICNNMMLGISMIAVSEAFVLADQLGLDAEKLFEISSNASGETWALTHNCPWPNILPNVPSSHDYQPGFSAKMMLKDLHLSQDAATTAQVETPLGNHAMQLYEQFVKNTDTEIDFSGIIKMLNVRKPI